MVISNLILLVLEYIIIKKVSGISQYIVPVIIISMVCAAVIIFLTIMICERKNKKKIGEKNL